jgi:hypothetical protein
MIAHEVFRGNKMAALRNEGLIKLIAKSSVRDTMGGCRCHIIMILTVSYMIMASR